MDTLKNLPFTKDQMIEAGLISEGASGYVMEVLQTMSKHPNLLGDLSIFALECINDPGESQPPASPIISEASTAFSALAVDSTTTYIAPYAVSDYERVSYYHGISLDSPELLYRSDLQTNPFPVPKRRHSATPTKTVVGMFNTQLNKVWDDVAPEICGLLKARDIRYSAVKAARFVTHGEDEKDSLGPVVIWIAIHPRTTTGEKAHDVSPEIISLLASFGVEGPVIEWYEGAVELFSGPPLLRVTFKTDPTYYLRRFLTAVLGMPITTKEMEFDADGSVGFFFHENKTKDGEPSARVFGVSNCHVLRKNTTIDYEFRGPGAPRQFVHVAGLRRFQCGIAEIKARIGRLGSNAELLAREIAELKQQLASDDPEDVQEAEEAMEIKQMELTQVKKDIGVLEAFYKELNAQWSDIRRRKIGHVNWAPKISVDVEGYRYTRDFGTFQLDKPRFKTDFKGNVVDLGAKYSPEDLTKMFYPLNNSRAMFKFPHNHQLRITGWVERERLANPDTFDSSSEPCLIVMKYAGLEAYLGDKLGKESRALAIYNYSKQSGDFSAKGDFGSLIFDGMGNMVGLLHSGMSKAGSSHVTYATPAYWVVQKIKEKYPHADFFRTKW